MERSQSIDILRALALFLVCFGRHLGPYPADYSSGPGWFLHKATVALARGGWIGVDLFFVLSGFLVSGLLFREHQRRGRISGRRFLIRRGLKIYPSFWLLIFATVTLVGYKVTFRGTINELFFIQNYGFGLWGHTWSLAVEEHFYVLLLVFLLCLSRRVDSANPFRVIPVAFAFLAVACLIGRLLTTQVSGFALWTHFYPSHLRMDSLFFGVLISYFYHYHAQRFSLLAQRYRWLLLGVGVLALVPAFVFELETTPFIYTFGLTILFLGSGALLVASLAIEAPDYRGVRYVSYLGSHAYSIYLWHIAVANWLLPLFFRTTGMPWNWFSYLASYVIGTLGVGVALSLLIEFPTLRIRDRWYPSLARPLGVSLPGRG